MDEIIKSLHESINDENNDVNKYSELADKLTEMGYHSQAQILHDISNEEATHAIFVKCVLSEVADV